MIIVTFRMSFYDRAKKNFLQYLDPRYMKSIFKNQQENNSSPGFRILTQLLSTVLFGRRCSGGILQPKNLVVVVGPPKGGVATQKLSTITLELELKSTQHLGKSLSQIAPADLGS